MNTYTKKEGLNMQRFAFIVHPLVARDFAKKFSLVKHLPESCLEGILRYIPSFKVSHITGIKSVHAEAEGWFIGCPLTARQMLELPEEVVLDKIIQAGKVAENLGAKIVGLGAFTSVVGDAGITIAKNLNIAVTSGNSYTVATALEGTRAATRLMGKELADCNVVILGATGSIGAACTRILARESGKIALVARNCERLENLAQDVRREAVGEIIATDNVKESLKNADVVIAVTSALDCLIEPEDLKAGAVICDVARPRNVSIEVSRKRKDVLVIEGGIVSVPGNVEFGFNFGFPEQTAYACMAETMILALEGKYENFTLGREISIEQIDTITRLAKKHNFHLAGFRNAEQEVTKIEIEKIQRSLGRRFVTRNI